ncbi:MAG: hypothetical protein WC364_04890 [Eubacteriales bacterium]|jgi:hypothetical protein
MSDKDLREGEELLLMSRSAGWELLERHIQDQIRARQKELEDTDFTNLSQVAKLQGEIRGLKKPLNFLQHRERKRSAALQGKEE